VCVQESVSWIWAHYSSGGLSDENLTSIFLAIVVIVLVNPILVRTIQEFLYQL
jgi:hypothetical protein